MPYQVRAFGGLELLDPDGEQIDAVQAHSKGAAVLAYLATRPVGEAVDRADLVPLLWPDRPEEEGRASLRAVLKRLRDRLPHGALGGKGGSRLWLEESVLTSDVRAFRRALEEGRPREALDLYRGPFLQRFQVPDASPFNRWAEERRADYRRRAFQAALTVGQEAREEDELDEAERAYRRALDLEPLKEEAAAGLIRALGVQGKRADALELYESFRARLREELDLSPSEQMDNLAEQVRSRSDVVAELGPTGADELAVSDGDRPAPWWTKLGRLAAAVLAVGLVGAVLWLGFAPEGPTASSGGDPAISGRGSRPTVAVLPFENLSETREARPFLQGLHFELLTRLSSVDGLGIVSRTSVLPYRGTDLGLSALADSLGVRWVLEGGVQQSGDKIQVNAQLIDAETETQAWAASYERELTAENLFGIQEELTRKIVRALNVELTPEEERQVASVPTENTAAYELYLQAKAINPTPNARVTKADTEQSIRLYRRALELDSTFAEAWARLADAYVGRAWRRGWDRGWADSARRAAQRALNLDPDLADAHVQLGDAHWALGNTERQLEAYRQAWELKPEPGVANNLIVLLQSRGRYAEKLKWLDRVVATSPESPDVVQNLVATNVLLDRDSIAEAWRRYAREREISLAEMEFSIALLYHADPDRAQTFLDSLAHREETPPRRQRQAALALYEGDWKQARRLYRELFPPSVAGVGLIGGLLTDRLGLAWSLKQLNQRTEAEHIAEKVRADARDAIEGNVPGSGVRNRLAVAHLLLGDTARALDWLEKAVKAGECNVPLIESVPTLAPLRVHPRFQSLLERMRTLLAEERRQVAENGWGEPPEQSHATGGI